MSLAIAGILFCFLVLLISWFGYVWYTRPSRYYRTLGHAVAMPGFAPVADKSSPFVHVFEEIGQKVPVSPRDAAISRRYLIAAGFRTSRAMGIYYGIKLVLCAVLVAAAFVARDYLTTNSVLRIVLVAGAGIAGFFIPNLILEHLVSRRQETLRFALPDALDLMIVCVEAGLGLDQAILAVSRDLGMTHPELCGELSLVNLEMRAGMRRGEALRNLADRTGESEIRKLVAILIQTDRFGTSMAESLRTHSDFMRMRRRQEAEERAGKVGVKLVFPIFFFLLPAMLVVAAGPGLLQVFKYLVPMMRNFNH